MGFRVEGAVPPPAIRHRAWQSNLADGVRHLIIITGRVVMSRTLGLISFFWGGGSLLNPKP